MKRWSIIAALLSACGGSSSDEVSYARDIHPLFMERCVMCHEDGVPERSLRHPFDETQVGMFTRQSRWWEGGHRDGLQYNVVPGDPDNSFLMQKITDTSLKPEACDLATEHCPAEEAGLFMPPRPAPMTQAQIDRVSQWILDGATDTPFFRQAVVPLFGEQLNFRGDFCGRGGYAQGTCILCGRCHSKRGEYPLLELPPLTTDDADALVAEWLDNLIPAPGRYRPDLQLIVPGDPDASYVVMKMKAKSSSTALGAPMPYGFEPLNEEQVDTVRRWIAEGARNN